MTDRLGELLVKKHYITSEQLQSLVYDIWEAFLCRGLCIGLLVLFREKLNFQGPLARNLAVSTYAVYLFHVPVIVTQSGTPI